MILDINRKVEHVSYGAANVNPENGTFNGREERRAVKCSERFNLTTVQQGFSRISKGLALEKL
jgi:hypothetical protein